MFHIYTTVAKFTGAVEGQIHYLTSKTHWPFSDRLCAMVKVEELR